MSDQSSFSVPSGKIRVHHFAKLKEIKQKFTMITAYDFPTGLAADTAQVESVLVGDSLGMVALGLETTLPVSMEIMLHHTLAVRRAVKNAFLVADMPFLSDCISVSETIINAGRLIRDGGAEAVKIEGGESKIEVIKALVDCGIPVLAHIGLTPQSVHAMGGFRVQGKDEQNAKRILKDALMVQEAGAFAVVLEAIPSSLATQITEALRIPTIGIGAGKGCDGQVLVCSDVFGMLPGKKAKFVKQYVDLHSEMVSSIKHYIEDVKTEKFPNDDNQY